MVKVFRVILMSACVLFGTMTAAEANADLTLVSPGGPGSFTFTLQLDLVKPLSDAGFNVIPTSKPGALGILAANYMRSTNNPHQLLVAGGGITKYESVANKNFKALIYDYEFVGPILSTNFILVSSDPSIKSIEDILNYSGMVTIGTTSSQTTRFIDQFNTQHPGKFLSIPYKDSNQQYINMLGRHVQLMFDRESFFSLKLDSAPGAAPLFVLGTTGTTRTKYVRLKSDVVDDAIGVMVRRDAPTELKKTLDTVLRAYYADSAVIKKYQNMGMTLINNEGGSYNNTLKNEILRMEQEGN